MMLLLGGALLAAAHKTNPNDAFSKHTTGSHYGGQTSTECACSGL